MLQEDVLHCGLADFVSEVHDVVSDPGVAPVRILLFESDHEIGDLLRNPRSAWVLAVLAAVVLLGDEPAIPTEDSVWREQDGRCLQEFSRQALGLGGQPDPLAVIQKDAFVLFLLFLQDSDLLSEVVDGLPEFFVDAVCQARHDCKPEVLFHSPERLTGRWAAAKRFCQIAAQDQ